MKYGIVGYSGQMGKEIEKLFGAKNHDLILTSDVTGTRKLCDSTEAVDVMVDFSSSVALPHTIELCRKYRSGLVIGTTALQEEHFRQLKELAVELPVVQSFNFALGVNILKMILRTYAPMLADWDMEISETHHNRKKDAPSGTAILLRDSTGRDCPMHSLRIGGIAGDHSVEFGNDGELLSFTHRALARNVFALGALHAALFVRDAKPGLYTFEEVLKKKS